MNDPKESPVDQALVIELLEDPPATGSISDSNPWKSSNGTMELNDGVTEQKWTIPTHIVHQTYRNPLPSWVFLGGPPLHKTSVHGFVVVVKINPSPQIFLEQKCTRKRTQHPTLCSQLRTQIVQQYASILKWIVEPDTNLQTFDSSWIYWRKRLVFFLTSKYLTSIPVM